MLKFLQLLGELYRSIGAKGIKTKKVGGDNRDGLVVESDHYIVYYIVVASCSQSTTSRKVIVALTFVYLP